MLAFTAWLSELSALPIRRLIVMGVANVAYGTFAFSLARRRVRPRGLIVLLVAANALWAGLCAVTAILVASNASTWGVAQLLVEGVLVCRQSPCCRQHLCATYREAHDRGRSRRLHARSVSVTSQDAGDDSISMKSTAFTSRSSCCVTARCTRRTTHPRAIRWIATRAFRWRPRNPASFDCRPGIERVLSFEDHWALITRRLRPSEQGAGA